jgi:hypothetical protein
MEEPERKSSAVILPRAIFDQDCQVIDEQDEHVVLTSRLLKKLIRDNHGLLMELAVRSHAQRSDVPADAKAATLRQEVAILDDQDKHLVLTVRLPKEFIQKNLGMLSYLSDSCVD